MMPASLIPHSFVLADLFDVVSLELRVPDHVSEDEPGLVWVQCPECEGSGWLEGRQNSRKGRVYYYLLGVRPCPRCCAQGEVLDLPSSKLEPVLRLAA